ncbi:hypothetical protein [Bacillus sp. K2I17]|uniref:hypothetical protein n=1 Tax=Bacillus sp. K2I17 TaxID=2014743 RepID=UPI000B51608A|nr:hypothetical protein [Bacillus sp. K2I17]OWT48938.1 hypothetical protein CER22_23255 [Bacillus sp. K2I17]
MSKKRKDGKMQKTTVKRDIIVTTEGEFDTKAFVEEFVRILRNMERKNEIDQEESKKTTPKTESPNNKE